MSDKELRTLDVWIAKHIMGWTDLELYQPSSDFMEEQPASFWRGMHKASLLWNSVPHYSADPADAMQVLETCAERCSLFGVQIFAPNDDVANEWTVREPYDKEGVEGSMNPIIGEANTLPLAICRFAKQLFSK